MAKLSISARNAIIKGEAHSHIPSRMGIGDFFILAVLAFVIIWREKGEEKNSEKGIVFFHLVWNPALVSFQRILLIPFVFGHKNL